MGSSGGGGGSSGKIDYPSYVKHIHADWLANIGDPSSPASHDNLKVSITEVMNAAIGNSPYVGALAYNPNPDMHKVESTINDLLDMSFGSTIRGFFGDVTGGYSMPTVTTPGVVSTYLTTLPKVKSALDESFTSASIEDNIAAFGAALDDQLETSVLPRFRRGMQDINSVQSSSFIIGQALLYDGRTRELAKYAAELKLRDYQERFNLGAAGALDLAKSEAQIDLTAQELRGRNAQAQVQMLSQDRDWALKAASAEAEFRKAVAALLAEATRIKIVANKEYIEAGLEIDERDAKWDLEVFQYGANLLASAAGGTVQHPARQNRFMSALGGALSGAAAGAMATMSPVGALVGGVVGLIGGLL